MEILFLSSLGAAIGGFVGVILFFVIKLILEKIRAKPELIKEYLCGNNLNRGQGTESEGELMHHHGRWVSSSADLKKLDVDHPVWEWTRTSVGRGKGASTIYGPYSTDFYKPGTYVATFRIKATGISHPDDITKDLILLQLDVNKSTPEYVPTKQGITMFSKYYQVGIRYVRASELANRDWINFELRFFSDAEGIWEYRVITNDGLDNKPDNVGAFGGNIRIFFDTIKIQRVREVIMPSV
jgi:hypothetical protein